MRALRTVWGRSAAVASSLAALALSPFPLHAQSVPPASNRVALVIGEGAYRAGALPAAPNDAGLVAQLLAGAGFDVTGARDLDGDGLRRAVRDFLDRAGATGPDGIAVVYLAGRAVQSDGDDYVVPVDARLARPSDVPIEALRLTDVTHALAALPIQARVVVVDGAYAGGPAGDAGSSAPGLALLEAEQGELLAFNAAPGTAASPTSGPYGVYAQAMVAAMKQGGVPVAEAFDRVRLAVNQATGGAVVPWESDKLTRSFAFFDRAPGAPAVSSAQVPFAALEKRPLRDFPPDQAYDVAVARNTLPAYAEFLAAFPGDPLARRVRLLQAALREASFWRAAVNGNTPGAFWTYLSRYPKGPHAGDARRRLTRLAAAALPPPRFVPLGFDVPPPGPDEILVGPVVFDAPDLPAPPPPPVFLLPLPIEVVPVRPAPPPGPLFLPIPVPVAIPYVRAPAEPGLIAPPRGVAGDYPRPRPYARGLNGDGLVVQDAPPPSATRPRPPVPTAPARQPMVPSPAPVEQPAPQPRPAAAPPAALPVPPVPPATAPPQAPVPPTAPVARPLPTPGLPVSPMPPSAPTPPAGRPAPPPPAAGVAPPPSPSAVPHRPSQARPAPAGAAVPVPAAPAAPALPAPAPTRPVQQAPKVAPIAPPQPAPPQMAPSSAPPTRRALPPPPAAAAAPPVQHAAPRLEAVPPLLQHPGAPGHPSAPPPGPPAARSAAPERPILEHPAPTSEATHAPGDRHPACGRPGEPPCRP